MNTQIGQKFLIALVDFQSLAFQDQEKETIYETTIKGHL